MSCMSISSKPLLQTPPMFWIDNCSWVRYLTHQAYMDYGTLTQLHCPRNYQTIGNTSFHAACRMFFVLKFDTSPLRHWLQSLLTSCTHVFLLVQSCTLSNANWVLLIGSWLLVRLKYPFSLVPLYFVSIDWLLTMLWLDSMILAIVSFFFSTINFVFQMVYKIYWHFS